MDEVFFIEHYCLADGKHIILKDYQKKFINWLKEMKITELIKELQDILYNYGDTDVYVWNEQCMHHVPVNHVNFPVAEDFVMGLKDDKDYVDDFNMILESAVLS